MSVKCRMVADTRGLTLIAQCQRVAAASLEQLRDSPLRALARTLTSWLEPIVAMWRFSKSNGITEGFHNKMEMISRRAYGFRNFENYRLRVLTHCGWDGIINRVQMNARPPLSG